MVKKNIFILIVLIIESCTTTNYDAKSPEQSFSYAKSFYEKGEYDLAIQKIREFQVNFPYSKYVSDGDLIIANSHFELGDYIESAYSYEQFIRLHPNSEKLVFAMFRLGESYWKQSPEEIDREQENTEIAIRKWQRLLDNYPDSDFSTKAVKLIEQGRLRMVKSDEFIANYYCKKQFWHACAYRLLKIIDDYPQYSSIVSVSRNKAANALEQLASKKKETEENNNLFFKEYTEQQLLEKAKTLRSNL